MLLYLWHPNNEITHLLFLTHSTICETTLEIQTIFMAPINYARTSCIKEYVVGIICSCLRSCIECVFQCTRIGLYYLQNLFGLFTLGFQELTCDHCRPTSTLRNTFNIKFFILLQDYEYPIFIIYCLFSQKQVSIVKYLLKIDF